MVAKLSISLSEELTAVLDELARRRGDDRSPLVETLLRENPVVQEGIALWRKEAWTRPAPPPPGGSDSGGPSPSNVPRDVLAKLTPREVMILQALSKDPLTSDQASKMLGLSRATTLRGLSALKDQGLIGQVTVGRLVFYGIPPTSPAFNKPKEVPRGPLPP